MNPFGIRDMNERNKKQKSATGAQDNLAKGKDLRLRLNSDNRSRAQEVTKYDVKSDGKAKRITGHDIDVGLSIGKSNAVRVHKYNIDADEVRSRLGIKDSKYSASKESMTVRQRKSTSWDVHGNLQRGGTNRVNRPR